MSEAPDEAELEALAAEVGALLVARGERVCTAESCTGGWIAQALTATAGSSAWFERGLVTYANAAKVEMLGVGEDLLAERGAVSEAVALAMALGALRASRAEWALAVSGIAGPSGGSPEKPVGTVCLAWASASGTQRVRTEHFAGDRRAVRARSVAAALAGLRRLLAESTHAC